MTTTDTVERLEVTRLITAPPAAIFAVLTDPRGHVAIDSSGMLMSADGDAVTAVGDAFEVHMDREALGDAPLGEYDVTVTITRFEPDALIEWGISSNQRSPLGHVYGYRLEGVDGGTRVTSYYDWSTVREDIKARGFFPVISDSALKATLGILARTVRDSGQE